MTTQKMHYEASGEGIVHIFTHGCSGVLKAVGTPQETTCESHLDS